MFTATGKDSNAKTLAAVCLAIAAILLVYSQTEAFAWDEGFHLLAARLILAGKRPYLDFLFAQTPLNAYWNSLIMRVAGVGWRVPQTVAALETAGAVWLIADYVLRRAGLAAAVTVAVLMGLNEVVVWYATIPQAYGICLLLGAASFRFAVAAVEGSWWLASLAGMAAGAAASCSLLSAPIGPVLFVWLSVHTRMRRSVAFIAGAAVGLSTVILALIRSPKQFVFDVVGFHIFFRQVEWSGWAAHDARIVTSWLDAPDGLAILGLAVAGAVIGHKRREVSLCIWTCACLCIYVSTAHPTFPQYFSVAVPFAMVPGSVALGEVFRHWRGRAPVIIIAGLALALLAREIYEEKDDMTWAVLEPVIAKVKQVAPPGAAIMADEHIYLMAGIMPPPGLEWRAGHKIEIPEEQARAMHVVPQPELDKRIRRGDFAVLETCEESDVTRLNLNDLYKDKQKIGDDCFVLWNFIRQ